MAEKFSKTQWSLSKLILDADGKRNLDVDGRCQCGLCSKKFTITEDRQYQAVLSHLENAHNVLYADYCKKFLQDQQEKQGTFFNNVPQRRQRGEAESDVFVCWAVRHGVPYSAFDDPDWRIIFDGGTRKPANGEQARKAVMDCAAREKVTIATKFKNRDYTLAVDGGTTQHRSVLAVVGLLRDLDGTTNAFPIMTIVKELDDAAAIAAMIKQAIAVLPNATCIAVVSDNHAPSYLATSQVCAQINAFPVRCYVHCCQLEIKRHVLQLQEVQEAVELSKKHESYRAPVLTRWWGVQETLETVSRCADKDNLDILVAIQKVLPTMLQLRILGRFMEEDACTIPSAMNLLHKMRTAHICLVDPLTDRFAKSFGAAEFFIAATSPLIDWATVDPVVKTFVCTTGEKTLLAKIPATKVQTAKSEWREWVSGNVQSRLSPEERKSYAFWMEQETYFPAIQRAVLIVLKVVPSEASCERYFSKQKLVHTPIRNRLNADVVEAECLLRSKRPRSSKSEVKVQTQCNHLESLSHDTANYFMGIMINKGRFDTVKVGCEVTYDIVRPNGRNKCSFKVLKVLSRGGLRFEGANNSVLRLTELHHNMWSVSLPKK